MFAFSNICSYVACALLAASSFASFMRTYASTETVLYNFCPSQPCIDGHSPYGGVVFDKAGNLYGTTYYGGALNDGEIFKLTPTGTETVLHSFANIPDGSNPYAGLTIDANGNLYGTTFNGGKFGFGSVFEYTSTGTEVVLYNFAGGPLDGASPYAGVVRDGHGNLYGTTYYGGKQNEGTVYKIAVTGTEKVLHSFGKGADGAFPYAGLTLVNGVLYGTTTVGGANGRGAIFQTTTRGAETVIYSFCSALGCTDGYGPYGGLIVDATGNIYGTTRYDGTNGAGVVFELTTSDILNTLYTFCSQPNCIDGSSPYAGLVFSKGVLYGTTLSGGNGVGTVFALIPGGPETVLHSFNHTDGWAPYAPLVERKGKLYSTTQTGGAYGEGEVFRVTP